MKSSLFLFLIFLNSLAYSSEILVMSDCNKDYYLNDYLEILEDKEKNLTIDQVTSSAYSSLFERNKGKMAINQNLSSAYWLKFTIRNECKEDLNWILESYDFKVDNIKLYEADSLGNYHLASSGGDTYPFSFKKIHHKNLHFLLSHNLNVPKTYYMRVESGEYVAFIFVARSVARFVNYALKEYYLLGIYYGILIIIICINLFLFINTKDQVYFFYLIHMLCLGLFSMTLDGTAFQIIWPNHPKINTYAPSIASLFMVLSSIWYAKSFLNNYKNYKYINRILYSVIALRVLLFIYSLIFSPNTLWDPILDLLVLMAAYVLGVISLFKGYTPARFYVAAFTFICVGFLTFSLANQGIISSTLFTVYSINYGAVLEIVLLSVALADRVRGLNAEKEMAQRATISQLKENENLQKQVIGQLKEKKELKEKLNKELEEKVLDRTRELREAKAEIQRMNFLLSEDNQKLEKQVKEISKARVLQKNVSFEEFKKTFPDEAACYTYLAELKWSTGFTCIKCGHTKYCAGDHTHFRRCSKCGYNEPVTANTLFYRLKFPIIKAFYMVFLIAHRSNVTLNELHTSVELRKHTCWIFKQKVLEVIEEKKKKNKYWYKEGWAQLLVLPTQEKEGAEEEDSEPEGSLE